MTSAEAGELILVDGGMCHFHLRRDGQLTIHEILVLPSHRRLGIGRMMLRQLKSVNGADRIFAKCPIELESNGWYERMGFQKINSDKRCNHWMLSLSR